MYALLFSCIALLLGLLAIITSIFLPKALPKELFEGIIWLGIYILAAMVWGLTDSTLLLLFTGNTYLINFVSFLPFFFPHALFHAGIYNKSNARKKRCFSVV